MNSVTPFFRPDAGNKAKVALFLSGTGSNARVLLQAAARPDCPYTVSLLVTDAPETSAARALAAEYRLPLAECDIKAFYAAHGEADTRLNTPRKQQLRDLWSEELYRRIMEYSPDFGVLAGFVSLTNIVSRIPCLNVHPGDLTIEKEGVRILAGLHLRPVETALLLGHNALRSSVILTQGYRGNAKKEVDSGPVLGISAPVPVDRQGRTVEELRKIDAGRQGKNPDDALRKLARINVENLKIRGDHLLLPQVVALFAQGRYGSDAEGELLFRDDDGLWQPVSSVEFLADGSRRLLAPEKNGKMPAPKRENRWLRAIKAFYMKMVREKGDPNYIARGWALGVWVGCVIPVFCQLIVAIPLSFVFRGSKIGAAAGTFVTTPPTAVFIYPIQIWVGLRVIGSSMTLAQIRVAISDLLKHSDFHSFINVGGEIIAAFFAGGLLWSAFMTPLAFFGVRYLVIRYRRFRAERLAKRQREGVQA